MKNFLLFVSTMLLAASCIEVAVAAETEKTTAEVVAEVQLPKVYSNCYDGYLNVRSAPSSKSQIVGKLHNGPDGAELLSVEGNWSKVRINGIEGYVANKYLQSKPTDPVYVDASVVIGEWLGDCSGILKVLSNGKFEHTFGFSPTMSYTEGGTWYLSRNTLVLKYTNGGVTICNIDGNTMINEDEEETFNKI